MLILHLSDMHLGKARCDVPGNPALTVENLIENLIGAVSKEGIVTRFDAIVISGDFTWQTNGDGFKGWAQVHYEVSGEGTCPAERYPDCPWQPRHRVGEAGPRPGAFYI
jgi:3',5'-cyclic AMP phosphodiesterase CpdA